MEDALRDVLELLNDLCEDYSIPKNVRAALSKLKNDLKDPSKELRVKIDAALQDIENLSLDPNLAAYARTQIWNLSSLLEAQVSE
jgi:uncharacterized protein (UPF0147 family)